MAQGMAPDFDTHPLPELADDAEDAARFKPGVAILPAIASRLKTRRRSRRIGTACSIRKSLAAFFRRVVDRAQGLMSDEHFHCRWHTDRGVGQPEEVFNGVARKRRPKRCARTTCGTVGRFQSRPIHADCHLVRRCFWFGSSGCGGVTVSLFVAPSSTSSSLQM